MIKSNTIRFHVDNPEDMKAWNYLNQIDSKKYKSQNKFMIQAIIKYYELQVKIEEDPYFETRVKEDAFINRIIDRVEKKAFENLSRLTDINLLKNNSFHAQAPLEKNLESNGSPIIYTESDEVTDNEYLELDMFG